MTSFVRAAAVVVSLAGLLALSLTPALAADGPPIAPPSGIGGDSTSGHATLDGGHIGSVGVSSTVTPGTPSGVGAVNGGTYSIGTHDNSSGGGNGGGGVQVGPPILCLPGAVHLHQTIQLPDFGIQTGPPQMGVTGLPTWFWTDPYQGGYKKGASIGADVEYCPNGIFQPGREQDIILYVDIWPDYAFWDWGDGNGTTRLDCGKASGPGTCKDTVLGDQDTNHVNYVYPRSSTADPKGYIVKLTVHFLARIYSRSDLSDSAPLPEFDETASTQLPVNEIQSILATAP
jgi:hypothetical protein